MQVGKRIRLALSGCYRYGFDWFPYRERIARLRESIRIMKGLWTQKTIGFDGTYYKLRNAVLEPRAIRKPHPPIWVGGPSESIMRTVAEEADGWDMSSLSLEELKTKTLRLHRAVEP